MAKLILFITSILILWRILLGLAVIAKPELITKSEQKQVDIVAGIRGNTITREIGIEKIAGIILQLEGETLVNGSSNKNIGHKFGCSTAEPFTEFGFLTGNQVGFFLIVYRHIQSASQKQVMPPVVHIPDFNTQRDADIVSPSYSDGIGCIVLGLVTDIFQV